MAINVIWGHWGIMEVANIQNDMEATNNIHMIKVFWGHLEGHYGGLNIQGDMEATSSKRHEGKNWGLKWK